MAPSTKAHWVDDPHRLWGYAEELESVHMPRLALDRACLRLGYSRPILNARVLDPETGYMVQQGAQDAFGDLGHSLTHEVVGAAAAQLCRPLQVKCVPTDADAELLEACEEGSSATNGVLDGNDFLTEVAQRVVTDGMHCSVGFAKVAVDRASGDLEVSRVDPMLMRWPRDQGPKLYDILELQSIPRRRLEVDYAGNGRALDAIRNKAKTWVPPSITGVDATTGYQTQSDCVKVVEGWAVQVGRTPGRHVIACEGAVLVDEPYEHDVLPYAPYRWEWDFRGFEGVSLARRIGPYDVWSRRLVHMLYESLKAGVPIIFEHETESAFEGITDIPYARAKFNGAQPPQIQVGGKVDQDVVAQLAALRERAFAQAGISMQAAQGQVPPGFKSAPSINAWSEVVNLRALQRYQLYDAFYACVGGLVCRFGPDAYKGRKVHVRSPDAEYMRAVKFPNLQRNKYRVTVLVTSGLPRTFSGRVTAIETLKGLGAIKPGTEARFLEVPDLDAVNAEATAPRKLAEAIVTGALREGKFPEFGIPSMPELLGELLPLARANYQRALHNGTYRQEHIDVLWRVIRVTEAIQAPPEPAPLPDAAAAELPPELPPPGAPPPMVEPPPPPIAPPPLEPPVGLPPDQLAQVPVPEAA